MIMMGRALFLVPLAAIATVAFAQAAQTAPATQSKEPVSALKGHDSNAPIDVSADRIEVQERADRAVFSGNVHVKQAEMTLDTARLTVAYSNAKDSSSNPGSNQGIQIQRLDASGGVVVKSPTETARGDFGVYDLDRKLITLVGSVQLNRQDSRINGSRLVIDLTSGHAVIDGGAPGVGRNGGRVTGHFTVPQKKSS